MPHPTHGRASSHEIPVRALSLAPHQIVAALEGRLSQLRYPVVSDIPEGARLEPLEDGHGWDVFVDSDGRSHWRDTIRPLWACQGQSIGSRSRTLAASKTTGSSSIEPLTTARLSRACGTAGAPLGKCRAMPPDS